MEIFDYWHQFKSLAYSDELLIGIGAVLLIIGIIRIVKSSITMLFWVILSALGLAAITQGLDQSPFQIAAANKDQLAGVVGAGKEMSADVLSVLCRKLDENELLQLQLNEN